ncbi:hypothetical protein Glove_384g43 [Diversispora epigaea]|uniref:Zn(2)-C6 fungal-type domain-containing protein n=1 Tax=Diversispora epigaea TaxID=1348612 RepID=A0A397H747_9GLOM|nr:hypothetical protein Glove_384g43 [Diversispora epigaea]
MPKERKNATIACEHCKRIKKKCDNSNDNTPCVRCSNKKLKCVYPPQEKRGRKKKTKFNNNNLVFLSKNDISTISKNLKTDIEIEETNLRENDISTISEKLKTDINQTKIEEAGLREFEEKDISNISENLKTDTNQNEIEETDPREIKEIDENEISYLSNKYNLHENAVKSFIETCPQKSFDDSMTILSATSDIPYSEEDQFAKLYAENHFILSIEEKDISENLKTNTNQTEIDKFFYFSHYDLPENAFDSFENPFDDLMTTSDIPYFEEDQFAEKDISENSKTNTNQNEIDENEFFDFSNYEKLYAENHSISPIEEDKEDRGFEFKI